ncbi:hypothetical protein B0T19DRAFT_254426 [Cercophora scortea]|uniref:AAA+ ATPase domain-containing protein n=1 Tax=Cercophora scortea TaxID=314031 RepID=A0AAE0M6M8_9PEZI|nr:hypothetical protein B0T19DRAFT_254426 [Cercophora scortea]
MPAAGARALLSAKARCSCRHGLGLSLPLPRVGASVVHHHEAAPPHARSFRTSAAALEPDVPEKKSSDNLPAKPASAATEEPATTAAAADQAKASTTETPESTPQTAAEIAAQKDARRGGYRLSRPRAVRARVEEVPGLSLPAWFMDQYVSLYESRPIGGPNTLLFPLGEEDREAVLNLLSAQLDRATLTQADIDTWKDKFSRLLKTEGPDAIPSEVASEVLDRLMPRFRATHNAVFLQTLALVHREGADPEHIERLRQHHSSREDDIMRLSWWSDEVLSKEAQRWLANLRSDSQPGSGALHGSPLANRPELEYPVCMELLAAVRAELQARAPSSKRKDVQRPVTVLSVLNRKGRSVPISVVDDVATDLGADVVHLDASSLAILMGKHLGQQLHWNRRSISVLGYAAAEINGRMAPRAEAEQEHELGMVTMALPSRLRSFLSSKDSSMSDGGVMEGRWEEMKMAHAIESIVAAADAKREAQQGGSSGPERDLIIHVHDYVEISSLQDGLITKLRAVVDSIWQKGRKVVLIGSSSSEVQKSSQWRDQLVEMGRDAHHIIPFHASEITAWTELHDNLRDNLVNIEQMLKAMLGSGADITFDSSIVKLKFSEARTVEEKYADMFSKLSDHVFDVQWVYRLTSLMIGSRSPRFQKFGFSHLQYALNSMSDRDKHWTSISPAVRPPYFSPLFTPRSGGSMSSFMSSGSSGGGSDDWPSNLTNGSSNSSKDYDQHEKKLLSGLINAKDIHTTFNDIIVPAETKESLLGLTTLSLVRPDAFSYGVLKTERIPGCLLYGPPGTGKTLLAKAVAKESGANMLEVSAASINDMWLGQSEKNVRALFSLARKMAPMVIFLDEADALLGARHNGPGRTGHRETITQFLREWDGLSDMRAFIMVATNRPFDLDEAVLRRLPRKILVDLPLTPERSSILSVMLRDEQLAPDVDLATLAKETELYSGSDLKNLCVSAAMEAVRAECRARDAFDGPVEEYVFPLKRELTRAHFEKAMREISASISEDMDSLKAIRKFDEQYGDAGRTRKGRRSMGFEVVEERKGSGEARVRQVVPAV